MDEVPAAPETFMFQAEINQLMTLIVNAFYSNKDVFLRELISNASDAIDKARHTALQQGIVSNTELAIRVVANKESKTLTIADDGIGMSREDLILNLGTIARSGTKAFMEALSAQQADMSLIGQFGVGFYSAYLVADRVSVMSRSDATQPFYNWVSAAGGTFTIEEVADAPIESAGTMITLYLRDDTVEYLEEAKIRELVTKHNAYISHPIYLEVEHEVEVEVEVEAKADEDVVVEETAPVEKEKRKEKEWNQLNSQKPIWLKAADDVTQEEHDAFYKNLANDWEAPLAHKHIKAEGNLEFRGILYTPRRAPFDMFQARDNKRRNLKLFVRRVFITDDCEELVPEWLTFVKGVIDSDDLPLNISREMLQKNHVMKVIQKTVVKKAIEMFQDLVTKPEDFKTFYDIYSKNLKLGVYEDDKNRAKLVELLRFASSNDAESMTSLLDYTTRAKPEQKKIYYITGDNLDTMRKSPFIERLVDEGYEVLFLKDAIDEYMSQRLTEYKPPGSDDTTYTFVNVSKEGDLFDDKKEDDLAFEPLCAHIKDVLQNTVEKVVVSSRLAKAPAAIVTGAYGWTANMERIMKAQALQTNNEMQQYMKPKKVLEINPSHPIIVALKNRLDGDDASKKVLKDLVHMLFDTTLLASGFDLENTTVFVDRIHRLMSVGMNVNEEDDADDNAGEAEVAEDDTPPVTLTKMEELD